MRGQPTGGIIINSPALDTKIGVAVRAVWASDNPPQKLLDYLLLDYSTHEGKPDERSFQPFASSWQANAATRLLYYFPTQTVPMIAARLDSLDVSAVGDPNAPKNKKPERRIAANGVLEDWFLEGVSWCWEPRIRRSIRSIFQRATDTSLLNLCLPSFDPVADWPVVRDRLIPLLQRKSDKVPETAGVLTGLVLYSGEKARPILHELLRSDPSTERCSFVQSALYPTNGEWDTEFLLPMLSDKRPIPSENGNRVCDEAAFTIGWHHNHQEFDFGASEPERDRQVEAIRKLLAAEK